MIYLDIKVPVDFSRELLEKAAGLTLSACGNPGDDLGLVLGGDEDTRLLNNHYLGIDSPTDVLSFPAGEIDPETGHSYLGDVIISIPRAVSQANRGGHTPAEEVQLLVVHGVLHLLGYDHGNSGDKKRMWAMQAGILADLGLQISLPEE